MAVIVSPFGCAQGKLREESPASGASPVGDSSVAGSLGMTQSGDHAGPVAGA